ncbi:16S rRNA (guanine(527)-N(7))-methyltransferase RsmG [bacterium]|nr:16S rRNA (guanine(527)-N(7))-methyltransferase RsmG [bacterium]
MSDQRSLLEQGLQSLGIAPAMPQLHQYELYIREIRKWSRRTRLVGDATEQVLVNEHILDSLTAWPIICQEPAKTLIDLGSGAGFPGLCLAIIAPELVVTLLDSRRIRTEFLKAVVRTLELKNCTVLNLRLDRRTAPASQINRQFDLITARAFGPLETILEYGLPLLADRGRFVLHRGPCSARELEQEMALFNDLGLVQLSHAYPVFGQNATGKIIQIIRRG